MTPRPAPSNLAGAVVRGARRMLHRGRRGKIPAGARRAATAWLECGAGAFDSQKGGTVRSSYDAIVIGSGFGGAVAGCRLAQAGLKVAIAERGRRYGRGEFPRDWNNPADRWLWQTGQGLFDLRPFGE